MPVTAEELRAILEAGFAAPSAHNRQPRHYYVVRDREKRETIARIGRYTKMASEADLCIVIAGDTAMQKSIPLLTMDCSASIENMLLAAHGLGLGAVWCGVFPGASLDVDTLTSLVKCRRSKSRSGSWWWAVRGKSANRSTVQSAFVHKEEG
jgi:nitroreductase